MEMYAATIVCEAVVHMNLDGVSPVRKDSRAWKCAIDKQYISFHTVKCSSGIDEFKPVLGKRKKHDHGQG